MSVVLPECRRLAPPRGLSPRQQRELVRVLAEQGPDGLEAWLHKEEQRDPTIRARVEALRADLERDARARRRRLEEEQAAELEGSERHWERRMRDLAERERDLHERLEATRTAPGLSEDDLLASSPLYRAFARPQDLGVVRRIVGQFRRIWILLVSLWVRFVRRLRGKKAPEPGTVVRLPVGIDLDLRQALGPDAIVSLRSERGGTWHDRMRRFGDRLLGREDYEEAVRRRLQEQAARIEAELLRQRTEEEGRLEEELRSLEGEDRNASQERDTHNEGLRRRQHKELEDLDRSLADEPYQRLRDDLLGELQTAGLVDREGRVTARLVERFSALLYEEARRSVPGEGHATPGIYLEGEGEYESGPMRSLHEIGAIDLNQSLLQSRIRHPRVRHIYSDDVMVHREVRTERSHLILVFDASGSMEEQGRLDAAKRVCLVLWRAVKQRNPDHRVDLLKMQTSVEPVDLAACWNAEAGAFTNHGAAFREARRRFEAEGADRKTLYVVTDGLPEAWTGDDGVDHAGQVKEATAYALRQAHGLRDLEGLRTVLLQLETRDPQFLDAARELADAAGGRVEGLDPAELVAWMMGDYDTAST